ncbi:hypothetical protein DVH24_023122 [Malus domestica]|uniref:Uncharacterized protein n=1 Tax=Malus domestica TaxID=3750 RepID=A0A498KMJ0_MALDO|nr:hypothetical protein DVH24_023122 [Malus domestica]
MAVTVFLRACSVYVTASRITFSKKILRTPLISPLILFTPPLLASLRIAGLVMPWMLSRRTLRCRFAPPLPRPLPPFPRPDIFDDYGAVVRGFGERVECAVSCGARQTTDISDIICNIPDRLGNTMPFGSSLASGSVGTPKLSENEARALPRWVTH